MRIPFSIKPLYLALLAVNPVWAGDVSLGPVVVTAETLDAPLMLDLNPQQARQPIPAHDGADYLKTLPGFSVIRKGGVDGDPLLRGLAGSRLPILMDGEVLFGGCGNRMDPPTAYVFPESYDRVVVIKGPQSVQKGPGHLAGSVEFERDPQRYETSTLGGRASATVGSFGRLDQALDIQAGNPSGGIRVFGNHSTANDYKDGHGNAVRSQYERWNAGATLTLTPSQTQQLAFTVQQSDGEAAYADRSMDGVKFARDSVSVNYTQTAISPLIQKLHAQAYYHYVDHVMDNFTLRPAPAMRMLMNPDRQTEGGKLALTLTPRDSSQWDVGIDAQRNRHTNRMNTAALRVADARFQQVGVFAELNEQLSEQQRVVAGARHDYWRAKDVRPAMLMVMGGGMAPNSSAGRVRHEYLTSGFARYEQDNRGGSTYYAGIGRSARMPDYWELISYNKISPNTNSAFFTQPEVNTQFDVGALHRSGSLDYSVSAFVNRIDDYVLIQNTLPRNTVRNIDAKTYGLEASVGDRFLPQWHWDATLAYVRGYNLTDNTPLAQLPPLELRLATQWQHQDWSVGVLWRAVAAQHRVDIGKGNIVGQDIAPTGGFGVLSLNAAYQLQTQWQLSVGVDNLLDKGYAEHLSRTGQNGVATFTQTLKVNEPGRNAWLKVTGRF